jgi:hypothetical protein
VAGFVISFLLASTNKPAGTKLHANTCPAIFYSLCYVYGGFVIHYFGSLYFIVIQSFKPLLIAGRLKVPTFLAKRFFQSSGRTPFFVLQNFFVPENVSQHQGFQMLGPS